MFFYYILTAYLIPGIYVYLRINYLLVPKGKKIGFTLIFILLMSAFPLSERLSHNESDSLIAVLFRFGNYTMPFLLYLFLLVLLFDLFLLINLPFKWLPKGFIKDHAFRKNGLIIAIIVPLFVVFYGIINFNLIRTSEYNIEVPGKSTNLRSLKIAFVSDFHIGDLTNMNFVNRFSDKMKDIQPDIILYGGDMLEGDRENIDMSEIEAIFRNFKAKFGVYGVLGNHEYHGKESSKSFYLNTGIKILMDTAILIDNSFCLAGRRDYRVRDRKPISDIIAYQPDTFPILLLDHRPVDIEAISQSPVDIQLSGHTHHGQLFPFNYITKKVYGISWGHRLISNTHFFVSCGIQLWGPPVRTVGKSEIMVINVKFIN